ncbi:hypothetical protein C8Q78DRAFT_418216 [Trametes maxima]|nr:hypothetical protein C8Q78DRAFT_418216 [Trametes maxima]
MSTISSQPELRVPEIVVTPAMPSRSSLSSNMRVTLDSIVGPAPNHAQCPYPEPLDWTTYGRVQSTPEADEHENTEVPHAPSPPSQPTPPASEEDPTFLLELDFDSSRFSYGTLVSALEATCGTVSSPDADADNATDASAEQELSRAGSDFGSEYVVVTEETSPCPTGRSEEDCGSGEEDEDALATRVALRPPRHVWRGHPTWRHAMYISAMVWPTDGPGDSSEGNNGPALEDSRNWNASHFASRLKSGCSSLGFFTRVFAFGRFKK